MSAAEGRRPRLVLRSSWQTVNIGDIAHTPGVLRLLEEHLPEVEVRLWPSSVGNGVEQILRARFPNVAILKTDAEKQRAMAECDFLLHGSGPSLVAERDVLHWAEVTGKPYGVYGITFSETNYSLRPQSEEALARTIGALSGARFVYFRDSVSLELAKSKGCRAPIMGFAPDGAFAVDLTDEERAAEFLARHGLERGKFLCCIPRHRYTPYWSIPEKKAPFDPRKHEYNQRHVASDHAPLIEAIVAVVTQADMKVLLCPEDQTQMELGKSAIYDQLPEEVRAKVAWRPDYWLTGEARSVYLQSAGLFGHEMHSPIMCIGSGVPAIVCRSQEQTSKGFMWRDIGLEDWLFDLDKPEEVARIAPAVLRIAQEPAWAKEKAAVARARVEKLQADTMRVVGEALG
ncbi:polysaccharide pyruvyl transferase family protein [Aeoliella sp. SH292]|uniref:polysaccharide pyruvyl transferase family protein n=1 Tax=Aeoliella sp. SH292 TaxID=3454464 RepID=UPI003F9A0478